MFSTEKHLFIEVKSTTSVQIPPLSPLSLCWKITEIGLVFKDFFTLLNLTVRCLLSKYLCPRNAHTVSTPTVF